MADTCAAGNSVSVLCGCAAVVRLALPGTRRQLALSLGLRRCQHHALRHGHNGRLPAVLAPCGKRQRGKEANEANEGKYLIAAV